MSHIPIHPSSFGKAHKVNVHGHIHDRVVLNNSSKLPDERYFCVSAERTAYTPIELNVVLDILFGGGKIGETIQT
jgi:hypothetical protein